MLKLISLHRILQHLWLLKKGALWKLRSNWQYIRVWNSKSLSLKNNVLPVSSIWNHWINRPKKLLKFTKIIKSGLDLKKKIRRKLTKKLSLTHIKTTMLTQTMRYLKLGHSNASKICFLCEILIKWVMVKNILRPSRSGLPASVDSYPSKVNQSTVLQSASLFFTDHQCVSLWMLGVD